MIRFSQKFVFCLICLSFLTSCTTQGKVEPPSAIQQPGPDRTQNKKERIDRLSASVFCISIVSKGNNFKNKYSVGTAFLVGKGLLASALHVQAKAGELSKTFKSNEYEMIAWKTFDAVDYIHFPIELFVSDKTTDMAIFRFDDKILKENPKFSMIQPLTLAENLPAVGDEVIAIGYYGDYQFPFNSVGNVSMIDKNDDIFSDVTIVPGNSGAPICSLETGEVLGITVSVLDLGNETVRFGIAKRASKLRELLQRLEKKN